MAPREESANETYLLATFDEHRALLFSVTYRMLGSRADAEDMLQETFLRWQQGPGIEIKHPRAFLLTVITRLCINQMQWARVKREEYFGQWRQQRICQICRGLTGRCPWLFCASGMLVAHGTGGSQPPGVPEDSPLHHRQCPPD